MRLPTPEEAQQFAMMLHAGLPADEAILYFLEEDERGDPHSVSGLLDRWKRSTEVAKASEKLMGKSWQSMDPRERIEYALSKHYTEMAFYLFSRNFASIESRGELEKAKEARNALEAKLAGTAGKLGPMEQFLDDLRLGKVKLPTARMIPALPVPES